MAKPLLQAYTAFNGGIADFIRDGITNSFAFGRSIDVRSDPQNITVLPRTIKESGTIIADLVKWSETYTSTLTTYMYGDAGNLYSRSSAGSYTLLRTVSSSHGNGLVYSAEDDYLYYSLDKVIGRYGPLSSSSPTFTDNFLGAQGGVPLNTHSLDLESSSSQYASRADTASLSITGSIAFDVQVKPESLPAVGNQMVLVSKWDESGATRSYKFDINTASGYFGDGSDGALTISADTTEAPIDSACTGTSGTYTLSATNASFAAGQIILIHQTQGTGAGTWMRNTIQSYSAGTITLGTVLNATYTTGAQVRVMKQYTNVTINSGITYTAKAWDGTVGGILAFICSGTFTNSGTLTASGKGFRGAAAPAGNDTPGFQGEGTAGASGTVSSSANGNAGGGGGGSASFNFSSGGGGSNGTQGTSVSGGGSPGQPGATSGSTDLTTMTFGGSGGSGGAGDNSAGGAGGNGGGILFLTAATFTNSGTISNNGSNGSASSLGADGNGGGAGAGGSNLFKVQTATIGTVTANGGTGGSGNDAGGDGGDGRNHLDYYTSYTNTVPATPTLDATQDNSLVTNTSTQLRLTLSSNGSNSETLAFVANLVTGSWQQVGVSWDSSTRIATFYLNAVAIGTRTGTLSAIHDNASTFQVGMSKDGGGAAANFYDGKIDEVRLFNTTRSASDMLYGLNQQIATNTTGLVAYYKFNNSYNDATSNANNLTSSGSPVFTTDVPYPSPTTRLDIDQVPNPVPSGNTYAVPTSISEAAADRLTFTPGKDPQKSIQFNVANIGTGTWTITIHDQFNNVIATSTVTNGNMHTGGYEFVYTTPGRPLTNFTNQYHAHITCASGSPTVVTGTVNDLETADYVTYYQFLVTDTQWHPMTRFLNFWVIGNERYVGKYEATLYEPNKIILQAGFRVRCFALWREYLAIGVMKGSNIYDFDYGRIYFWDGYSPTFNFFIDVPEGGINAMLGSRGKLFIWAGYKNQLLVYEGGDSAQKLKDMPKMESTKYSEIYPQAVCMWQSLLRYGVAGAGDSTAIQKGAYTYGSTNLRYPDILTYDYPISTGNYTGTNLKVGMLTVVGKKLLMSWQDGTGYGIDYVDNSNSPFTSALIEFLITDSDAVWKEKEAIEIDAIFSALNSGESISLRYALEGSSTFTTNADSTSTGNTTSRMLIPKGRYKEAQVGLDITADTTAPTIKGVLFQSVPNATEERYG